MTTLTKLAQIALAADAAAYGSAKSEKAQNRFFAEAAKLGWDWEQDEQFCQWALSATVPEIITEALKRATR